MIELEFGSTVAYAPQQKEFVHISDAALEAGLKISAQRGESSANNNDVKSHPEENPTTNIVCVKFLTGDIAQQSMSTGDPVFCGKCSAILNYKSVVTNGGTTWGCEFCGNVNQLQTALDEHEIPTTHVTDYLLEPPGGQQEEHAVIFCLDISGSMDTKVSGSNMSRLDMLRASMDTQLVELSVTKPESRVGLVIFHDTVTCVTCTDSHHEFTVEGHRCLSSFEAMVEASSQCKVLGQIKNSLEPLRNQVRFLRTAGSTALGPALALSVSIAGRFGAGSQVIACTDGEANVGIGSGTDPVFYATLAQTAKQNGVSVSVMSFAGTNVHLEQLSVLSDQTGGTLKITDAQKLAKNMSNILTDSIIMCGVEVTHIGANTGHELLVKKNIIGNCVKNSDVTAEFTVPYNGQPQTEFVFQTQVRYTRASDRARWLKVFTTVLLTTHDRAVAEKNANQKILALHAVRTIASRAQEGVFTAARLYAFAQQLLLARIAEAQGNSEVYLRALDDIEILDGELRYSERQEEKAGRRERGDRDRDRDRDSRQDRRGRRDDREANVFYQMKSWNARNMRRSRSRSPPRNRQRSCSPPLDRNDNNNNNNAINPVAPAVFDPTDRRRSRSRSRSPPARRNRARSRSPVRGRGGDRDVDMDLGRRDDRDRRDRVRDRDVDRDRDTDRRRDRDSR